MVTFLKCYQLGDIKKKVQLLYILNVTDWICTFILLKTGYFHEINPLLINTVEKPIPMVFIKILAPILLLGYIYQRIKKATNYQLKVSNIFLNGAVIFYGLVNLMHIFYFVILTGLIIIY